MKYVMSVLALSLVLSFSACTKKEAAPEGGEQVEGTTSAPADAGAPPAEEMQEKKEGEATPATAPSH